MSWILLWENTCLLGTHLWIHSTTCRYLATRVMMVQWQMSGHVGLSFMFWWQDTFRLMSLIWPHFTARQELMQWLYGYRACPRCHINSIYLVLCIVDGPPELKFCVNVSFWWMIFFFWGHVTYCSVYAIKLGNFLSFSFLVLGLSFNFELPFLVADFESLLTLSADWESRF